MASIRREIHVRASPEAVWDAVRDIGAVHERLAPGFVTNTVLEPGARVVTFASGLLARELIVDCDDETRRLVWAITNERLSHYNASMQVFAADSGGARIVWVADLLPDTMRDAIGAAIEAGMAAIGRTFDQV